MARGVQFQGSFLGGQFSIEAQGRLDHPWHASALSVSYNGLPTEGGQWTRRSGTCWLAPTYLRATDAAVKELSLDTFHRHAAALTTDGTDGYIHLFRGKYVVTNANNVITASSSSSGVVSLTSNTATGWAVGDHVIFTVLPVSGYQYLNRWCKITAISTTSITIKDDNGTAFLFDSAANALAGATISRIYRAKITGLSVNTRLSSVVNIGNISGTDLQSLVLNLNCPPALLTVTTVSAVTGTTPDVFSFGAATLLDGPYFDQKGTFATPETGTVNAYTGSITFTPASSTFTSVDVGKCIRLFSEPPAWASGTTYALNATVKFNGAWWKNIYGSLAGVQPGTLYTLSSVQYTVWAPAPTAGQWAWGTITAQASTSCTVLLTTNLNSANGATIAMWRMGVYQALQYPQCGILFGGRLWLGGAVEGRLDGSMSENPFTFSPTDINGNVFDDHALALKISSATQDHVEWFRPDRSGLLFGTHAEEYVISGSSPDAAITPLNFDIKHVSSYGSAYVQAITAAFSHVFVQTQGKQVFEFVTDVFASSPSGRRINQFQQDMIETYGSGIDLAYTETKVPVIWMPTVDGTLLSCTYRRFSRFMSSPPDAAGWSAHQIADGVRDVTSVSSLECMRDGEAGDYLYMTTLSGGGPPAGIEVMMLDMLGA